MRTGATASTGYLTIEKIRMGAGLNDIVTSGKNWITHLDARKYYASGSANQGVYTPATNSTEFTLPAPFSFATGKISVVTKDGYIAKVIGGNPYNSPNTGNPGKVTVEGNYSNKDVWIGLPYTMEYQFSTQYLRSGNQGTTPASLINGRYQLKYLVLQFAETGYFEVVSVLNDTQFSYPFTGEVLGTTTLGVLNLTTGTFKVPIYGRNDTQVLKIRNNSHLPSKFLSAEIEGEFNRFREDTR